jgi:LysM repeat protein
MRALLIFLLLILLCRVVPAQETLKQMRSGIKATIDGKEYYIHTIKKGQSLYMISKAYGVEVDEIIRINPEVKKGLVIGQKLRIPVTGGSAEPVIQQTGIPEEKIQQDTLPAPLPCKELPAGTKKTYNIALMLPLFLSEAASMDITGNSEDESNYEPFQFVEFYEGFRIAMDSLERKGDFANIYVYDVVRDTLKTKRILRQEEWKDMNLVIAMIYKWNFHVVADYCRTHKIPVVNPLSERSSIIEGNPYVIKATPGPGSQAGDLCDYLSADFPSANIILIHTADCLEEADRFIQTCKERDLPVSPADGYGDALKLLSREKENVVVVCSNDKVYSLDLITKLHEIRADYPMTLVGLPRWDKIEDYFEADHLVNLKAHFLAPRFVDYEDPGVRKFVRIFQERYATDPDPLAFLGFDIGCYFLSFLRNYGSGSEDCLPGFRLRSLQTDFRFNASPGNGYENRYWVIYKYEDYRLRKVN